MVRSQQTELWIFLAVVWWLGSMLAWLLVWMTAGLPHGDPAGLTVCGLFVFSVSLVLRLPVLTPVPVSTTMEEQWVWLLGLAANWNWLGCCMLRLESLVEALPLMLMGASLEIWLLARIGWRWSGSLGAGGSTGGRQASTLTEAECQRTPTTGPPPASGGPISVSADVEPVPMVDPAERVQPIEISNPAVKRVMHEGLDEAGRRYMAGEIKLGWQTDQRTEELVVGFVPAFSAAPDVELELDVGGCAARCVNCTPLGMRLVVHRAGPLDEEQVILSWYALEAAHSVDPRGALNSLGTLA